MSVSSEKSKFSVASPEVAPPLKPVPATTLVMSPLPLPVPYPYDRILSSMAAEVIKLVSLLLKDSELVCRAEPANCAVVIPDAEIVAV